MACGSSGRASSPLSVGATLSKARAARQMVCRCFSAAKPDFGERAAALGLAEVWTLAVSADRLLLSLQRLFWHPRFSAETTARLAASPPRCWGGWSSAAAAQRRRIGWGAKRSVCLAKLPRSCAGDGTSASGSDADGVAAHAFPWPWASPAPLPQDDAVPPSFPPLPVSSLAQCWQLPPVSPVRRFLPRPSVWSSEIWIC